MFILRALIILLLGGIFFQDIKSRAVYWFWFPLLIGAFLGEQLLQHAPITILLQNWFADMLFLLPQFLLLTLYFCLKERRWVNLTDGLLGWGDVLLLICIGVYFPLMAFILFYLASLVLIVLSWLVWQAISKNSSQEIPLAGIQALLLAVFLVATWIAPGMGFWYKNIEMSNFNL